MWVLVPKLLGRRVKQGQPPIGNKCGDPDTNSGMAEGNPPRTVEGGGRGRPVGYLLLVVAAAAHTSAKLDGAARRTGRHGCSRASVSLSLPLYHVNRKTRP